MPDFDELRLALLHGDGGTYRLRATLSTDPDTDVIVGFRLPFDAAEIEHVVPPLEVRSTTRTRGPGSPSSADAMTIGSQLYNALFRDNPEIYSLYEQAAAAAHQQDRRLRLVLRTSETPELGALPWELLYKKPIFLARDPDTPLVRFIDTNSPAEALMVEPPLRVLAVIADRPELPPLDVEGERAVVDSALAPLVAAGAVEVTWLTDLGRATFGNLEHELQSAVHRERPYHALHYIGHGVFDADRGEGVICLDDSDATGIDLANLLAPPGIRLVVLNACEGARFDARDPLSGVASTLVEGGIPAVVAMQFPVSDEAAIVFAKALYEGVAAWQPIDVAVTAARRAMAIPGNLLAEWATPVLFLQQRDGRIIGRPTEPAGPRERPRMLQWLRRRRLQLAALAGAALIVAAIVAFFPRSGSCPTSDLLESMQVSSLQPKVETDVELCDGDILRVTATGSVQHALTEPAVGPEGKPDSTLVYENSWDKESNHGALVGRIGDGEWFYVGPQLEVPVSTTGPLTLAVNDRGVDNNAGAFEARVAVERGGASDG
jgi:hypothetical protein